MPSDRAPAELAALAARGFAAVGPLVDAALAAHARALGAELIAGESAEDRRALRSLGSLISVFSDARFSPVIHGFATALRALGFDDLRFSAGYFISKPGRSPASFWHQDWGFWGDARSYLPPTPQVGILWYLVDVDVARGCPRFLPGSHRRRHPIHAALAAEDVGALRRGDDLAHAAYQHPPEAVSVPARAGDVVLFDPRVLHGAHANTVPEERPAMAMWFYPQFEALSAEIRAFAAGGDPIADWPAEARAAMAPLMPRYAGPAAKAALAKYPDARLA